MKKIYNTPIADIISASMTLLAGSGPRGGDCTLPQVNGEESQEEETCHPNKSYLWDTEGIDG